MGRVPDAPEQYCLQGIGRPVRDRIFFALFPDPGIAARAADIGGKVCRQTGLRGKPFGASRLHVSLHWLGDHAGVPPDLVARAREAASSVRLAPFEAVLDRLGSFKGRPGHHPLVLTGGEASAPLAGLHGALGAALARHGAASLSRGFNPHVTLLYGERCLETGGIEALRWTVREFWLLHSLLGAGRYARLGRYELTG